MNLIFLAFFLAIALFQAIVVGQDDPSNTVQVTVTQFSYTGNGCPPRGNNATASLVMAGATMTSIFDNFTAYAGPNVKTDQNLKTCNTTLHLQVPNGLRFTMAKIDVRGYTNMTKEFVAFYRIAYSLGSPNNMYNSPIRTLGVKGPVLSGEPVLHHTWDPPTISPCGGKIILNSFNEVGLGPLREWSDLTTPAFFSMDSKDYTINWQRC